MAVLQLGWLSRLAALRVGTDHRRSEEVIKLPMKRLGLSPVSIAATLFLGAPLQAEEAIPKSPVSAQPKIDEAALKRRSEAVANEVVRRRALQALRADLLALFDRNGDGKLEGDELVAIIRYFTEPASSAIPVMLNTTPVEESARLEKVAREVEKRRAARTEALQHIGGDRPVAAPVAPEEALRVAKAEVERLERVVAELAQCRAEQDKTKTPSPE
jgi:hypothetical protein